MAKYRMYTRADGSRTFVARYAPKGAGASQRDVTVPPGEKMSEYVYPVCEWVERVRPGRPSEHKPPQYVTEEVS